METERVQLGPFELRERVGAGGMGVVYRARHVETGGASAIKVLLSEIARQSDKRRAFRREVQTLAKLHHPGIAAIVDYGEIEPPAAEAGPTTFVQGAPWFAMEYVDGRPLSEAVAGWGWRELESFLATTLDALAHAHARGIIHRDLKRSNILIGRETGAVKLVDFGVARVFDPDSVDEDDRSSWIAGTPDYMAPEQFLGEWRDQGPWTDLYALGCLTWRIVCGVPPYSGDTTEELLEAHMQKPPSEFEPRFAVPEGLEAWLRSLLETRIERRRRRAADAARALRRLDTSESPRPAADGGEADLEVRRTVVDSAETIAAPEAPTVDVTAEELGDLQEDVEKTAEARVEPPVTVPGDWRRESEGRRAAVLPKAGLQLFGLREVPLVDRDPERDRLWEALRRVDRKGTPHLVTLEAGPGIGKSRLARWLCQRAHELGAATVERGVYTENSGPDEGLQGMVRRAYRTAGLGRGEVFERLLERLPALEGEDPTLRVSDARALTEFLRPTDDADAATGPQYRFSSVGQKYAVLRRFLARQADRRPVLLWLDDLQWGPGALEWLEAMFDAPDYAHPVLVVATVRADIVTDNSTLQRQFSALDERDEVARSSIGPLESGDHRALVDRLLDLAPDLADRLVERTEGNPLFAIQLLRDWVERGTIVASDQGFRIGDGVTVEIPADIHRLWIGRLQRLVDAFPPERTGEVWRAMELAAALGREVDAAEWDEVCREVGLDITLRLVDRLVKRGLANRTDTGWAFAHVLLVESLERRAMRCGRWQDHHRRCARMLERVYPDVGPQYAARRAEHWEQAGDLESAIEALREEIGRLNHQGEFEPAIERLKHREALLGRVESPEMADARLNNQYMLATARLHTGREPERVLESVQTVRRRADDGDHTRLVAKCLRTESRCHRMLGDTAEARMSAEQSVECARRAGDGDLLASALIAVGWVHYGRGDLDLATERLGDARHQAAANDDAYTVAEARRMLGLAAVSRGDFDRAKTEFEDVLEEARRAGFRRIASSCLNGLGEIARFCGEAEAARRHYREVRRLARELGRPGVAAMALLNRAHVELMDRELEVAGELRQEAVRQFEAVDKLGGRIDVVRLARLVEAAGLGAWSRFDRIWEHFEDGWPESARLERDSPWLTEMAGDYAAEAGRNDRALACWRLGLDLWERLGDEKAVRRLRGKLPDG